MDGRFRTIVENARDVVTVLDEAGIVTYENPAVERFLGHAVDDRVGQPLAEVVHPDDRERVEELYPEHGDDEAGGPNRVALRHRNADGGWVWLESVAGDARRTGVEGWILTSRPIADPTGREDERTRRDSLLDAIFERLPVHLFVKDAEARHVRLSEHLVDEPGRYLGKTDPETRISTDDEATRAALEDDRRVIESGERIIDKEEYYPDLGVWFLTSKVPWYGPDGETLGLIGSARDITELKERNEQLALLNRIVRHDIRNDVNVVAGWIEQIREEVPPGARDRIDDVADAAKHVRELTYITGDLLAMIEEGGTIETHPVELAPVLAGEIEQATATYESAAVSVGAIPDVTVQANAMLSSVFSNLLSNAVQHNGADDPRVEVDVAAGEERVVCTIADDGPGIPEDRRDAVFGRGTKGIDSDGIGVGLYLVDTLVDAYDGSVWIEDNEPRGTVFHVQLRRAD